MQVAQLNSPQRRFRVEIHGGNQVQVLGHLIGVAPHFRALDLFLSRLPPGATGQLVLVDDATGKAVARRHLGRLLRREP